MRKLLVFLVVISLVFGVVGSASAYLFDMGAGSSVDTSGTNSVLKMYADVKPLLDLITYELNPGEYKRFYFATLGTTEGWINEDDVVPGTIAIT